MKIMITGSAGYIGSCLFEYLKKKYEVFGVDKTLPKLKKQKNFIRCNLLNFNRFDNTIKTIQPDIIIHLAAKSTIDFIDKKREYIENNEIVTKNILRSIKKNNITLTVGGSVSNNTIKIYKDKMDSKRNLNQDDHKLDFPQGVPVPVSQIADGEKQSAPGLGEAPTRSHNNQNTANADNQRPKQISVVSGKNRKMSEFYQLK